MISNRWLKMLYKADEAARSRIIKKLERELKKAKTQEVEFKLYYKLATAYGYIGGRPVLDIKKATNYWLQVQSNQDAGLHEQVWAQIQLSNLYRLDGLAQLAINGLRGILEMGISDPRIQFEHYWVLAVCYTDDNKLFAEYTQKAREAFEKIKRPDMLAIDKHVCTGIWLGPQRYREGIQKRWSGKIEEAKEMFEDSGKLLAQAIKDCDQHRISRVVDPLLHMAILHAFCREDHQKAIEYFVEAQRTGVWYVNEFAKLIIPMCMLLRGIELTRIEELNLRSNENEVRSWLWAKIELTLAWMDLIEQEYWDDQEILERKILEIAPQNFKVEDFPEEFGVGVKLIHAKMQQLIG